MHKIPGRISFILVSYFPSSVEVPGLKCLCISHRGLLVSDTEGLIRSDPHKPLSLCVLSRKGYPCQILRRMSGAGQACG